MDSSSFQFGVLNIRDIVEESKYLHIEDRMLNPLSSVPQTDLHLLHLAVNA